MSGAEWHVHRSGIPGGAGLLLLHGLMGEGADWEHVMEELPDSVHAAAPDLPGHGRTRAGAAGLGFDALARGLAGLAGTEFDRPCVIAGYSMGGRIALYAALRFPGRFAGLVIVSSTAGIEDPQARRDRIASDGKKARQLREAGIGPFVDSWYDQPVFESLSRAQAATLKKRRITNDPLSIAAALERFSQGQQPDLWPELPGLDIPVQVIAGERDRKYRALATRLARALPRGQAVFIAGAGHMPHVENRADFVKTLQAFLKRINALAD
jgi:2-succinyl-6-hydroxy-2,4-cyclohexadiene-1-carboxylate synthase